MDALIQALYGIPIVGLVFEFGGYLIAVLPDIAPGSSRRRLPSRSLLYAGSCASGRALSTSGSKGS